MGAGQGLREYLQRRVPIVCRAWPVVQVVGDGFGFGLAACRVSAFLRRYLHGSPLEFSQALRRQGLWGSQKVHPRDASDVAACTAETLVALLRTEFERLRGKTKGKSTNANDRATNKSA